MMTTEVRRQNFKLVAVAGGAGKATGKLYVDDGVSVFLSSRTQVWMQFGDSPGILDVGGNLGMNLELS